MLVEEYPNKISWSRHWPPATLSRPHSASSPTASFSLMVMFFLFFFFGFISPPYLSHSHSHSHFLSAAPHPVTLTLIHSLTHSHPHSHLVVVAVCHVRARDCQIGERCGHVVRSEHDCQIRERCDDRRMGLFLLLKKKSLMNVYYLQFISLLNVSLCLCL